MTDKEKDIFNRKFNRWLDEWELEQELRVDGSDSQSIGAKHQIPFEEPIYKDIKVGDILLLSSELNSKGTGLIDPLFIAILRLWEKEDNDEFFLWAPYSPFTQPATDKEIKFENSDSRLSVLSLWNTHTSPKDLLSKSWFIGELEEKNRRDALKVFWYSLGMEELPQELENQVGAKLFNSKDPRQKYLTRELSKTEIIRLRTFELLNDKNESNESVSEQADNMVYISVWYEEEVTEKTQLVAGDKKKKGNYLKFHCEELPLILIFRSNARHQQMVFELQTDDDLLKEKIDQFLIKIEGKENQKLKFENGKSIQDTSMDFLSFSLISPDGKVLQLKKLEPDDV